MQYLCTKLTGTCRIEIEDELPDILKEELKKWPFTWEGRKWHKVPVGPDGKYPPEVYRRGLRSSLRLGVPVTDTAVDFLLKYPEHGRWLKDRLEPHLWAMIEPFVDLSGETEEAGNHTGSITGTLTDLTDDFQKEL